MAKYKAIKRGYDGVKLREPGEVFEFSGKAGSWMEPLDKSAAPAKKGEPKEKGGKAVASGAKAPGAKASEAPPAAEDQSAGAPADDKDVI